MSSSLPGASNTPNRAITDVYDEQKRTFLVQYPVPLVVALALGGLISFALAGFLGFRVPNDPTVSFQPIGLDTFFKEPWPLFLWFCALIMTLEISILRNRKVRGEMVAALVVTVISIILVGVFYFYGFDIKHLIQNVLDLTRAIPEIGNSPYTYALFNFGILAIFWADTIRRWVRCAMHKPLRRGVDIGFEDHDSTAKDPDYPSLDELISGDLIAGAALALVLALFFRAGIVNFVSTALRINVSVTTCTLSWPFGACHAGGTPMDPPTLFFINLLQTLIYLPLGLLILALSATVAGLGAAGGVNSNLGGAQVQVPQHDPSRTAAGSVSEQVAMTLFDTLKTAVNRRLRVAAGNFTLSLRNAIWPVLVFVGTLSVATASREIQQYLHLLSDKQTCALSGYLPCGYVDDKLLTGGQPYVSIGLAVLFGAVAVLAVTFAMALLIFRQRIAENTFRFLGLIGEIILLTFWLFSLVLSAFNYLLWLIDHNVRLPFPQPGASTIVSFACFVAWGVYIYIFRRGRKNSTPAATISSPANRGSGSDTR